MRYTCSNPDRSSQYGTCHTDQCMCFEEVAAARYLPIVDLMSILYDLKRALRVLRKTPGFTLAALIVLALGIGANTAIFSLVYGVLIRPLPFHEPERLVQLWHTPPQKSFPGMTQFALSAANYLDWEQQNTVFESSAIYMFQGYRLSGNGDAQILRAARAEPTFFSTFGVKPLLGRTIMPGDDQGERQYEVVLSHALWTTQFGGNAAVVGQKIQLNGQAYTVVGVMPPTFATPQFATMWTPLVWTPLERSVRGEHHFAAVARLKNGVTLQQAQSQLDTIAAHLAEQYPADNAGWGAKVVSLREETTGQVRTALLVLLGAVAFVLLIACANVANMMLAKTMDRRREAAICSAIGAPRRRVVVQMICEAVVLAVAGGVLGLIVADFGTSLVENVLGNSLPRLFQIAIDKTVLAFTFAIAVASGIAAGAVTAWKLENADPHEALKQGGSTDTASAGKRARNVLVVVEVALSLLLLVGACLMIRTFWNLRKANPGFDASHVLTMTVGVGESDYATPEQEAAFFEGVLQRVRAVPGVQGVGSIDSLPMTGGSTQPIAVEGQPVLAMADQPEVSVRLVSGGYFGTMRIPVLNGRDFSQSDNQTAPKVVVVSESFAKRFWPNENPIGKRMTLTFFPAAVRQVVGVVGDVKLNGVDVAEPVPTVYWPISQAYAPQQFGNFRARPYTLAVRTTKDPISASSDVRAAVHQLAPNTPLLRIQPMEQLLADAIAPRRFNMLLLATFAALALVLAAVGVYSVLAYAVRQRVHEIGIRMALGANVADVLRMVIAEGMLPVVIGVAIGVAAALGLGSVVSSLIYGVRTTDVPTFITVSLLLVGVAFVASMLPAYFATRVDPLKMLRNE